MKKKLLKFTTRHLENVTSGAFPAGEAILGEPIKAKSSECNPDRDTWTRLGNEVRCTVLKIRRKIINVRTFQGGWELKECPKITLFVHGPDVSANLFIANRANRGAFDDVSPGDQILITSRMAIVQGTSYASLTVDVLPHLDIVRR